MTEIFNIGLLQYITFDIDYLPLLIVVATAWLVPMLMSVFRLARVPAVIAEIVAGYFIGRYLLSSFPEENIYILDFLALTGFIFLMFLCGLEIDVDQIIASLPRREITYALFLKSPLLVGLVIFIITLALSYLGAMLLSIFVEVSYIWYFALIMVTSSIGIIMPVLKNKGETNSRFSQMIIIAAAIADILSIILFTFTAFIIKNGFQAEILLILILFIAFFISYRIGIRLARVTLFKRITYQLSHAASQIKIRGTLFIILIFVVIAQYIDREAILLGAFLAGLLLSFFLHKGRSLLMLKLDGMGYGFFIPVFFIMVGAQFDPSSLKDFDESLVVFLVVLLLILYAVKIIPSFLWFRFFGVKRAISGGFLMATRLSLIIAASKIGLDLGVISPGTNACFLIMAVVTCLVSPFIYNQMNPGSILRGEKIIIIGGSYTGELLAERLRMHGKRALIVESNKKQYNELRSKGFTAFYGSGLDSSVYEQLKLTPSDYVIALTGSDDDNIRICEMLRHNFNHEQIITKSSDPVIEKVLMDMGVEILDITTVIATTIENLIIRPTTYHTLVETFENYSVEEVKITNREIDGVPVREILFPQEVSLMLIKRGYEMHIPHGDTILRSGDMVVVFGTDAAIETIRSKFS